MDEHHDHMDMATSAASLLTSVMSHTMASMQPTSTSTMASMDHSAHDMDMDMDHGSHAGHGMDMGGGGSGPACKISMLWNWNTIDACFFTKHWQITSRSMFAGSCIGVMFLAMLLPFLQRLSLEYSRSLEGRSRILNRRMPTIFGEPRPLSSLMQQTNTSPTATSTALNSGATQYPPHISPLTPAHHSDFDIKDGSTSPSPRPSPCGGTNGMITPFMQDESTNLLRSSTSHHYRGRRRRQQQDESMRRRVVQHVIMSLIITCQVTLAYLMMLLAMYFNGYIFICIILGTFFGNLVFGWNNRGLEESGDEDDER